MTDSPELEMPMGESDADMASVHSVDDEVSEDEMEESTENGEPNAIPEMDEIPYVEVERPDPIPLPGIYNEFIVNRPFVDAIIFAIWIYIPIRIFWLMHDFVTAHAYRALQDAGITHPLVFQAMSVAVDVDMYYGLNLLMVYWLHVHVRGVQGLWKTAKVAAKEFYNSTMFLSHVLVVVHYLPYVTPSLFLRAIQAYHDFPDPFIERLMNLFAYKETRFIAYFYPRVIISTIVVQCMIGIYVIFVEPPRMRHNQTMTQRFLHLGRGTMYLGVAFACFVEAFMLYPTE